MGKLLRERNGSPPRPAQLEFSVAGLARAVVDPSMRHSPSESGRRTGDIAFFSPRSQISAAKRRQTRSSCTKGRVVAAKAPRGSFRGCPRCARAVPRADRARPPWRSGRAASPPGRVRGERRDRADRAGRERVRRKPIRAGMLTLQAERPKPAQRLRRMTCGKAHGRTWPADPSRAGSLPYIFCAAILADRRRGEARHASSPVVANAITIRD
jgi:hypothetical protein